MNHLGYKHLTYKVIHDRLWAQIYATKGKEKKFWLQALSACQIVDYQPGEKESAETIETFRELFEPEGGGLEAVLEFAEVVDETEDAKG